MELFAPDGNSLISDFDAAQAEIKATLSANGTYTLLTSDRSPGVYTGDYGLFVQRTFNPGIATAVSYGKTLPGSISAVGEVDTYTFSGKAGDKVIVKMTRNSSFLDPWLEVFRPDGEPLGNVVANAQAELRVTLPDSGTYAILTSDQAPGDDTGDYTLFVQRTFNPGTPVVITYGKTSSAAISIVGEVDTYTFSGNVGDKVILRMSRNSFNLQPLMELFAPDGNSLISDFDAAQAEIKATLSANGTYTLLTSDRSPGAYTGNYGLFLQRTFNPGTAVVIKYGEKLSGNLSAVGEVDTYTFSGNATDSVIIRMAEKSFSLKPMIELFASDGEELNAVSADAQAEMKLTIPRNGAYTILASTRYPGSDIGDYEISLFTVLTDSTPRVTTNPATEVRSTSATLNGAVNPNGLSTTARFEYGLTTNYGSAVTVSSPVNGTSPVSVNVRATGLTLNTMYHFRVVATNRAGTTNGADQTFQTTPLSNPPPVIAHTPLSLHPSGQALQVIASITDETGVNSVTLNFRRGGDMNFTSAPMSLNGSFYQATIQTSAITSRGVEYFIVATDVEDAADSSAIFFIPIRVENEAKPIAQPNGGEQTAYRLFSVPLDLDIKSPQAVLEDDLGPYSVFEWRFYDVRADQTRSEFPNVSDMTPGKSFWLIVKDPDKVIDTGAGKSNLTSRRFAIPLHPKWNLVANPFNFPIPISKMSLQSRQTFELRTYAGTWNDPVNAKVTSMLPFEGYAVFNGSTSVDSLLINPDLSASGNQLSETQLTGRLNNQISESNVSVATGQSFLWAIRLHAQCQQARDIDNIAAVSANASDTHDELDRPEPPVIGEYVSVYFPHPEWKTLSENYCTDVRSMTSDNQLWTFEVKTNIRDVVQLSFEGLDSVPPEFEVWLMDEVLKISHNLREKNHYSVAGIEHPKRLTLVVGKRDFIDKQLATLQAVPSSYELSQNFPNPFNPLTTIRYGLPKEERVTLKVYNFLGQEVTTLVDDELKPAGYHAAIWDGRNKNGGAVASGVYFVRLRAGPSAGSGQVFVQTRKMALIE